LELIYPPIAEPVNVGFEAPLTYARPHSGEKGRLPGLDIIKSFLVEPAFAA
jgi:hypothetical protein